MVAKTSYLAGTPSWCDLMSPDLATTQAFYGGLFGWTFSPSSAEMGGYCMAFLDGKTICGMMPRPAQMAAVPSAWTTYFDTKDIQASVAKIEAAGGTLMGPAHQVADFGSMAIAFDPSGAAFGLWQANTHIGAQLFGDAGAMTWNELASRDLKASVSFFAAVLGNPIEKMDAPTDYYLIKADGKMHGGISAIQSNLPKEVPSHWTVYFAVTDADATSAKIKALGGTVSVEPFDTPYGRNGYAIDATGANFAFIQAKI